MWHESTLDDLPTGRLYDGRLLARLAPLVLPFRRRIAVSGLVLLLSTQLPSDVFSMGFFSLMAVFEIVGLAIILFAGGRLVERGLLTIGSLVLFLGYLRQIFAPLYAFSEQVSVM